jgi:hypothetical protein
MLHMVKLVCFVRLSIYVVHSRYLGMELSQDPILHVKFLTLYI